jgi:hypothetical protein
MLLVLRAQLRRRVEGVNLTPAADEAILKLPVTTDANRDGEALSPWQHTRMPMVPAHETLGLGACEELIVEVR